MKEKYPVQAGATRRRAHSIRTSVLAGLAVIVFFTSVIGGVGGGVTHSLRSKILQDLSPATTKLDASDRVATSIADMRTALRGVILFTMAKRSQGVAENRALFGRSADAAQTLAGELVPLARTDEERQSIQTIRTGVSQWATLFEEAVRLCAAGKPDVADQLGNDQIRPIIIATQKAASEFAATQRKEVARAEAKAISLVTTGLTVLAISGALCLMTVVWVIRFLNGIIGELRQNAATLAGGAQQVASAARQIESSSQSLAQGAAEQAASLEQTSASSTEVTAIAGRNAESSRRAAALATDSSARHGEAVQLLDKMTGSMQRIKDSSNKVASILKVIDKIAFQTNILALNAAVEAARAGEAGLGFAVVADEVRDLAHQCADAAKETAVLIDQSVTLSNEGDTTSKAVADAIRGLITDAAQIQTLVDGIETTSDEQATATEQIADSIRQLEETTQRVAAQSEESAAASQELSAQSLALEEVAGHLTVLAGAAETS